MRLPPSGLVADLPLVGLFPKTPTPDAGLSPDVLIDRAITDIAEGRDPVLERAVADMA